MKSQKGFTVVEILLVILLLGVISFGGYYIWSKNKLNRSESARDASTSNTNQAELDKDLPTEVDKIETVVVETKEFTVEIPTAWSRRSCSDVTGFITLTTGADGEARCIRTDATWLGSDVADLGKVAIAKGTNPYPRQDFSGGSQKDVYESDATTITLSSGKQAKKLSYRAEDEKGKTYNVIEYIVDEVTVYVFDGHTMEAGYIGVPPTAELINIVEARILPSIKKL